MHYLVVIFKFRITTPCTRVCRNPAANCRSKSVQNAQWKSQTIPNGSTSRNIKNLPAKNYTLTLWFIWKSTIFARWIFIKPPWELQGVSCKSGSNVLSNMLCRTLLLPHSFFLKTFCFLDLRWTKVVKQIQAQKLPWPPRWRRKKKQQLLLVFNYLCIFTGYMSNFDNFLEHERKINSF